MDDLIARNLKLHQKMFKGFFCLFCVHANKINFHLVILFQSYCPFKVYERTDLEKGPAVVRKGQG